MKKVVRKSLKKVRRVFLRLKSLGYTTKEKFEFSNSCAWSSLSVKEAKRAVFYHLQDFWDLESSTVLKLSFSGNPYEIIKEFRRFGFRVDWNGDYRRKISVFLASSKREKPYYQKQEVAEKQKQAEELLQKMLLLKNTGAGISEIQKVHDIRRHICMKLNYKLK